MRKLKILFVLRPTANVRAYGGVVKDLKNKGHEVIIMNKVCKNGLVLRRDIWKHPLLISRQLRSYRRYFGAGNSDFFRDRWLELFPSALRKLVGIPGVKLLIKSKFGGGLLIGLEKMAPADKETVLQLKSINPDVLVYSLSNMHYDTPDTDYVKAAKALGIPTVLVILTWDNLIIKGQVLIEPDIMLAWNSNHMQEAVDLHGVPEEKIRLIGATVFDRWFGVQSPKRTREEFCASHGIDPKAPIFTYLGSSANIAKDETEIALKLKKSLENSSDAKTRSAQMIFRSHHANSTTYENFPNVRGIFHIPKGGKLEDPQENDQLHLETLIYSDFVVGINTSAMLEALILERPVLTYLSDEFRETQTDVQYFRDLLRERVIGVAESAEDFAKLASNLLTGKDAHKEERKRFIARFFRPRGLTKPASQAAAEEIEKVALEFKTQKS